MLNAAPGAPRATLRAVLSDGVVIVKAEVLLLFACSSSSCKTSSRGIEWAGGILDDDERSDHGYRVSSELTHDGTCTIRVEPLNYIDVSAIKSAAERLDRDL